MVRLYGKRFAIQREAMDEVIDWLNFYNHRRLHSTLAHVSPMQFEEHWHAGQPKQATQWGDYELLRRPCKTPFVLSSGLDGDAQKRAN